MVGLFEFNGNTIVFDSEAVYFFLSIFVAIDFYFTTECHKCFYITIVFLFQSACDGLVEQYGVDAAGSHDNGFCLPFHFLGRVLHEVVYHHIGFVVDDVWVLVHILHHQTECVLLFVFWCVFRNIYLTYQFKHGLEGSIVFQHVKDKAFLDGLFHGIGVECLSVTAIECKSL